MAIESKNQVDTSTEVQTRIEASLRTRSAPPGTPNGRVEAIAKDLGGRLWSQLRRRPSLGVVLTAGVGLALATAVGVGELTIAIVAGYAAYQVLREGVAPEVAAERAVEKLEKVV